MLRTIFIATAFSASLLASESELILAKGNKTYLFALENNQPGVVVRDFEKDHTSHIGAFLHPTPEATKILSAALNESYDARWHLAPPLSYPPSETPQQLNIHSLTKLLLSKRCAFYSGAGLSHSTGIPVLHQLYADLEAKQLLETCRNFYAALESSRPTPAHHAVQHIAQQHKIPIYTENIDTLHEASGITASHLEHTNTLQQISGESLANYDVIICLGLSHDWRGLLSLYRTVRPDAQIIAIDLAQPNYLKTTDGWLQGDLQELLPALDKQIDSHVQAAHS